MSSKIRRKRKLNKKEQKAQNRKELLNELLPLGKSFALWILLVIIVAADYTNYQWFSMVFVNYTTYLSYGLAKLLFIQADILGTGSSMVTMIEVNYQSIIICNFPMIIELECSAYHAYLAMISLVAFSWWSVKQKLIIGSILFAILSFINALRIVMLGVIGENFPNLFNMMHDYIWNILLVIIIWGMWEIVNKKLKPAQIK